MKLKRILSLLIVMAMVLSSMGTVAFASGNVAKVGNTEYATIDEAIANWSNNTTLTLLANVTLTDVIKLSSTEYHILDLGTYTMTAASGKDAIQYVVKGRSSAGYALDIKADATNPGGITATGKAVVSHIKPSSNPPSKDRPITRFYGGVFNASYVVKQGGTSSWGFLTSGYTGASAPYFQFYGGEYNGTIYTNRSQNQFYGGTFNGSMSMSVDSSAYTLIAGGTFKNLSNSMGSSLNSDKFVIGTAKGANDGSVCIDENGYYVISTTTPTEAEASVASSYNSSNYFYYSNVNTNGMYYEDVYDALEGNKTGTVTVFTDEIDLTDSSFTGTIVVPEGEEIKIIVAEGTTPAFKVESAVENAQPVVKYVDETGNELEKTEDGSFEVKPATVEGVSVDGVKVNAYINEGVENSYNITLINPNDWTEGSEVTITLPALDGAEDGDSAYVVHEHNGVNYIYVGKVADGKITFTNNVGFSTFTVYAGGLSEALTTAQKDDTIILLEDITGNVNINKSIVFDGNSKKVTGKLSVTADGATVKNLNVENSGNTAASINAKDIQIENCNVTGGNGFRYCYTSGTVTFKDSTIVGAAYGIHFDGNDGGKIVIDNCQITGWTSFAGTIEHVTMTDTTFNEGNYNFIRFYQSATIDGCTFNEKMTLDIAASSSESTVKVSNSTVMNNGTLEDLFNSDDIDKYNVYVNDEILVNPVAKIGDKEYTTLEDAFTNAQDGETITLLSDATPTLTSQRAITKASVIDLGGNTLTLTEDDLYFGTTTFKNGTIVVDESVKPSTAVFWMFDNQTLTFDNVKLIASGVTGTYLIGLDGDNSDLNLINGSEIFVENETALDLDIICVNSSTGNDILVENSKVTVKNLDGRVFFRGNYTVSGNSEVNLDGITKAGFRIEAGQTLTISDTANVTITGEPRDGGIHLTDLTSVYTVEDTATVSATINRPKVAKVGDVEFTDIQEAIKAAAPSGTVEIISDITVEEWIMIAESLSIGNGDIITLAIDGMTINGNGHTLTIESIESAGNGARMFFDAKKLNINNLTINMADGVSGIGLKSGVIDTVTFNGGVYGVLPQDGDITINNCTFATNGTAIYYEEGRDNLKVTNNTFNQPDDVNVILLRGNTEFTGNTVNSGRTVNVVSGSPVVTGNNFNDVRLKVYNVATATIENNTINNLVFNDETPTKSTFSENTLSEAAEEALDKVTLKVAKIGDTSYTTLEEALNVASSMTGNVTVEILDKVTLNKNLSGNYDSITFVGTTDTAEIYLDVQGYITATGKNVAFTDLTLSKSEGGYITNAGFMNVAFGIYDVLKVTYTNCTFTNGAYASSGVNTFTKCTFYRSYDKYGLWAYGDAEVIVDNCVFADYRGIKMYAEGKAKTTELTVTNTDFSQVTDKPAIVLTYGESVELEGNTYSSTGTFELDLDGDPNGTPVTSDVSPVCKNDNGACGVLVDGKIYTTVAQAKEVATEGSTVTLLHNSAETVELAEGVTLNKNGFEAAGITVKVSAPYGTLTNVYTSGNTYWGECGGNAKESFEFRFYNDDTYMGQTSLNNIGGIIDGDVYVSWNIKLDAESNTDEYWDMAWSIQPTVSMQPNRVEQWVDGVKVAEAVVEPNCPDSTFPVVALVADDDGKILSFVNNTTVNDAFANGGNIVILKDIILSEPLTVGKDTKVTLDLAGFDITYNSTTQNESMITNKGNLTVNDSVGTGVINYNYTGAADPSYGKGNYTITNAGTLTVNGGKITIANLSGHAKYPIDNNSTTGDAILVVNGGHLYNYNTSAIRQFCNSETYKNSVTINGGLIEGYSAIWVQNPGSKTVKGSLSVTGGEIRTTAKAYVNGTSELKDVSSAIYCTIAGEGGAWDEESLVSITGGIINENVYLSENAPSTLNVNKKICNGYVELPLIPVAKIGDKEFTSLQDAIDTAVNGDTIIMIADTEEDATVGAEADITIDLAGFDIVGSLAGITNNGTLTINDSVGTGNVYTTDVSAQGRPAILNNGNITINGGWFGDSNNDMTDRNAINRGNAVKNYGTAVINGGYFTNVSNQYIDVNAYAYAINTLAGGTTTVNNATVYGDINGLIYSEGTTIVKDGSYTLGRPNEENNLWYLAYGNVEICGGTWTRAFKVPSWNTGDLTVCGDVKVSGGIYNVNIPETNMKDGCILTGENGKITADRYTVQKNFDIKVLYLWNSDKVQAPDADGTMVDCYPVALFGIINNLNYKEVGFILEFEDPDTKEIKTHTFVTNDAYTSLLVNEDVKNQLGASSAIITPEMYDGSYFCGNMMNMKAKYGDSYLKFRPYAKLLDGSYVYGKVRTIDEITDKDDK